MFINKNIKPIYSILALVLLTGCFVPMNTFAQAIGEAQINSLYNSVYDTLKLVGPIFAVLYIAFNAVQVFTDGDNPNKKSKLINSVIISAVALFILFGAPMIVDQLRSIAQG